MSRKVTIMHKISFRLCEAISVASSNSIVLQEVMLKSILISLMCHPVIVKSCLEPS